MKTRPGGELTDLINLSRERIYQTEKDVITEHRKGKMREIRFGSAHKRALLVS